ncbi:hypothetical protein KR093_009812, partial [Drosophila rubida]
QDVAIAIRNAISVCKLRKKLSLCLDEDNRKGIIYMNDEMLNGKFVKLPTIVECYKTTDNVNMYKTANIHEMLVCSRVGVHSAEEKMSGIEQLDEDYVLPHGITPPTRNIRKRYRKHMKKKAKNNKMSEQEALQIVKQLIRADLSAYRVRYDTYSEDDSGQEISS